MRKNDRRCASGQANRTGFFCKRKLAKRLPIAVIKENCGGETRLWHPALKGKGNGVDLGSEDSTMSVHGEEVLS